MGVQIDRVILGDNQFFGVNHMSQEKGRESFNRFRDIGEIKKVLYMAMDNGIHGVMFSTHPAIYQITAMIKSDDSLRRGLSLYVNVPYIMKYISMVTQMGPYGTVKKVLEGQSISGKLAYLAHTALTVLSGNYLKIAHRLIDVEMLPFQGLKVNAIFLHNALCDLALGYGMAEVVSDFHSYVGERYGAIPAYGTLNLPLFCDLLKSAEIEDALVMTAVNKKGFLMNPSRQSVEEAIERGDHTVLAMATLASGSLKPEEAYEYVFSIKYLKHVVVGLSSKKHAEDTFRILRNYSGK